jgi:hypothetical protein
MPARAVAAVLFMVWPGTAHAELPEPIETPRLENAAACREAGGNPVEKDTYILQRDLDGDGQPDFVMNLMGLTCEGAFSYFCGSAGCPVTVWTSGPDGLSVAWNSYAQDITWDGDTMVAYLHGQFCDPPRTGADGCEERVSFGAPIPQAMPDPQTPAVQSNSADAPATDRWQLRDGGGIQVAIIGGTGSLRSLAAFCVGNQPWLAMMLTPAPAPDNILVDFTFSSGTIGGPAQRQPTTGGAFVIGLENNPLPALLAGKDDQVGIAVDGVDSGQVSLSGSTAALRAALGPCLRF